MKPTKPNARSNDRIARWIGFVALVALLAMATLPFAAHHRDVAVSNTTHWSDAWHG
jgi:hypothetical protein